MSRAWNRTNASSLPTASSAWRRAPAVTGWPKAWSAPRKTSPSTLPRWPGPASGAFALERQSGALPLSWNAVGLRPTLKAPSLVDRQSRIDQQPGGSARRRCPPNPPPGSTVTQLAWKGFPFQAKDLLRDRFGFDLEGDVLAEHEAAGLECLVPAQAKIVTVELAGGAEADARGAPR